MIDLGKETIEMLYYQTVLDMTKRANGVEPYPRLRLKNFGLKGG